MKQRELAFAGWTAIICTVISVGCEVPRNSASAQSLTSHAPVARTSLTSSARGGPRLRRIYFNPYTDSIKTVLNYYVNVEGEFTDGSYLPLDTTDIFLRCDHGTLAGNEWIIPKKIDFQKVTFIAEARADSRLRDTVTLWIQKWKDPRDAQDYKDPDGDRNRR
jgi:hypothetical protein